MEPEITETFESPFIEASLPTLKPLYFKAVVDKTTIKMEILPNQEGLDPKISPESTIKISVIKILEKPLDTIYLAFNYDIVGDGEFIVVRDPDYMGLLNPSEECLIVPDSPANKVIIEDLIKYYDKYVSHEKALSILDSVNKNIIDEESKLTYESIQGIVENIEEATGTSFKNTVLAKYPVPKVEDTGFEIDPDIWFLLVRNALRKVNTLLIGPTGVGKTEIVIHLAKALESPLFIQDMGTINDPQSALLGVHRLKDGKSIFDYAPFVQYVQQPSIILLDELSRAPLSANNILFPALDNRKYLPVDIADEDSSRNIPVNPDVFFIATANIGSEYSGTNDIDRALLDRFMPVELSYLENDKEVKVLMLKTGIDEQFAKAICKVANKIREQYATNDLSNTISIRHTLQIANLVVDGVELKKALEIIVEPLFEDSNGISDKASIKTIIAAY